jgi:hypothetical protein
MTTAMPLLQWSMTLSAVSVSLRPYRQMLTNVTLHSCTHTKLRSAIPTHNRFVCPLLHTAIPPFRPQSKQVAVLLDMLSRHATPTVLHRLTGTGMATPPPVATGSPAAEAGHPPTPPVSQLEAAAMRAVASESQQEAAPPTFVLLATQHYLRLYTPEGIRQGEAVHTSSTPCREGGVLVRSVFCQVSPSIATDVN